MKRHIAILKEHEGNDFRSLVLENLLRAEIPDSTIYLFTIDKKSENSDIRNLGDVKVVEFPDDCDNEAKRHNFISKYFKIQNISTGMLYVIHDNIEIFPGQFANFLPKLEEFMNFFGYRVWLNTVCDECNYIFDKYVTRITVKMDKPEYENVWKDDVYFTTNANIDITAFDLDKADITEMLFDESFSVAMFVIIKFLAERRNRAIPGCFMNLYPTIPSEIGIAKKHDEVPEKKESRQEFDRQMKVFGDMKIDNQPTIDANEAITFLVEKITGKGKR